MAEQNRQRDKRKARIAFALGRAFLGALLGALLWIGCCASFVPEWQWPYDPLYMLLFALVCALLAVMIGNRFFDRLAKPEE